MGERALGLMVARAAERSAFGRPIAAHGGFQQTLARCRIELDAARLTVLNAAAALDRVGNKKVHTLAAAKGFPILHGRAQT
jgi:acyl-CoA dehydrogenase